MKKEALGKICMLLIFSLIIGLVGCGSEEAAPSDPGPAEETMATGTGVAGERYTAEFNGHTYQFIDEDTTWEEARKMCIARGGHLATVTSAEEQKYLEGLFNNINGSERGPWFGAYSDGAYGGDKNDWCWVTGEKWNYTNWADGEPSNAEGTEWFNHFWYDMKWNDISNDDNRDSQKGYICEYDDLTDVSEGEEQMEAQPTEGEVTEAQVPESDPGDTESQEEAESESDWAEALKDTVENQDPVYKDLGDGRTAIQSHWRGVQIKYPSSYHADVDDDALYVYDGDLMYVFARNITAAAEGHKNDLASFCASKVEDQAVKDFTKLFGAPSYTDKVSREGGDGKDRVCVISGNMWNDRADVHFKSKVFISGKKRNFLVMYTTFWRYGDKTSEAHFKKIKVTSWGRGDMYGQ